MNCIMLSKNHFLLQCPLRHYIQNIGLKTMQAWQVSEYGSIDKLYLNSLAATPVIRSPIDILVKVHAASINPLDVRMLGGYGSTTFNVVRQLNKCALYSNEFPLVLGRDFSGTVVHVGKRVKNIKPGDEIWGASSPWDNGSHADYVLTSVCNVSKKPISVSHAEASSIPYAGLTAYAAITCFGGLSEKSAYGKRVLIIGASGGVGTFAVQLLKAWGADITATCSADAVEMVQNLGVYSVLDYQDPDFKRQLREMRGFDLILDFVGKDYPALTMELLKTWQNTKYVTLVSPLLQNADESGLLFGTIKSATQAALDTIMSVKDGTSFRWAYFIINGCALKKIAQMVDKKEITPVIEKIYQFDQMPQAYENIESGHARGKIVVDYTSDQITIDTKVTENV